MSGENNIIGSERLSIWTAVAFIIALLALIVALVALNRTNELTAITQGEVLLLNKKIEGAQPAKPAPAEPAAAQ